MKILVTGGAGFIGSHFEEGIEKTVKWYLENKDWMYSVTSVNYQEYYKKMYN